MILKPGGVIFLLVAAGLLLLLLLHPPQVVTSAEIAAPTVPLAPGKPCFFPAI